MTSVQFERLPIKIFQNQKSACIQAARVFQNLISKNNADGKKTIIGMATGSSPISLYDQLIRMHKQQKLSFKNVVTFNLDEYYPIQPIASQSYVRYMKQNLFDHIDIDFENNVNIPDGTIAPNEVKAFCDAYQQKIKKAGGLDIQLLGIGRNGHIGFNEPNSHETSTTRMITLAMSTREDASEAFGGLSLVPHRAITMGIKSIMKAKQVVLLAWGSNKMEAVYKMTERPPTEDVPSSLLQKHENVQVYIDHDASKLLTRVSRPWLVMQCEWTPQLIKTAVILLSLKLKVPILQLTQEHYNFNGLNQLLAEFTSHEEINIMVFNLLERTITGWPGGKPNCDDSKRPERALPAKKRIIVFSPHPDDDVISMGSTLFKLQKQGHEVHVCYQTTGSNSVFDDEAIKLVSFTKSFGNTFEHSPDINCDSILQAIYNKKPGERDIKAVKQVKRMIRQQQAKSALRFGKFKPENIHFLKMAFYQTGVTHKSEVTQDDLQKVRDLICKVKPHSIFMAGDLADPHGTHRKCTEAIQQVLTKLKTEYIQKKENQFITQCWVWMYKGAWQEWAPYEIQMAVPLSPDEVIQKRKAIFYHQSQKDMVMFRGDDNREFWERAEQRNATTANIYRSLGLASYAAIEAFARFYF